jgi:hypothetical protein
VFDEMDRLREVRGLSALLERYETLAKPDRQVWQDRVSDLVGLSGRELVKLHGELIAYSWIEQDPGDATGAELARPRYRITPAGLRALKQLRTDEEAMLASAR